MHKLLSAAALVGILGAGSAQAASPQAVVDANGKVIGSPFGLSRVAIRIPTTGQWFSAPLSGTDLQLSAYPFHYTTPDCTGTAYIPAERSIPDQASWSGVSGSVTLNYPTLPYSTQNLQTQGDGKGSNSCYSFADPGERVGVAGSLTFSYTAPISVK